jgi:hypothetical protein
MQERREPMQMIDAQLARIAGTLLCAVVVTFVAASLLEQREPSAGRHYMEPEPYVVPRTVEERDTLREVERLMREQQALHRRINEALDRLATAKQHTDREAANRRLQQLRVENAKLQKASADARAAAALATRKAGFTVSCDCKNYAPERRWW